MRPAVLLKILEARFPTLGPRLRKLFVEYGVPLNRALGIRLDLRGSGPQRTVLHLPRRRRNLNAGGTVHGGVITAFAETAHGVAVLWHFHPAEHRMVTRRLRVDFLAPAWDGLSVDFRFPDAMRKRIQEELEAHGGCDFLLRAEITDRRGTPVATLEGYYRLRRTPPPG
ncbi:MAG: PaaI family thioesterase [Acidobacteria bacterium]|nr:PaaI family thioesterase [Acidobacteriota bacterium]